MEPNRQTFYSLDAIRGLAAFFVVITHFNRLFASHFESAPLGNWTEFGAVGVDYFFLLSGFLMFHIHGKEWGKPSLVKMYALKRILRIYPMYWLAAILTLCLMTLSSSPEYPVGINWLYNVLLITPDLPRILGVSWTLNLEVLYYSMFALTFMFPAWAGKLIVGGWLLGIFIINLTIGSVPGVYNAYSVLFIAGGALSYALPYICRIPINTVGLIAVGLLGLSIALWVEHTSHMGAINQLWEKVGFSVGFILLVSSTLVWERRYGAGVFKHWLLTLLGQSSYVLYLFHMLVGAILFKMILVTGAGDIINHGILITGLVLAACLVGFIINRAIETPLNKLIKKRLDRHKI